MKKKTIITMVTLIALFCSIESQTIAQETPRGSGVDFNNLMKNVNPAEDFYQYACGGWMKNHPLTGEYSRYGSFDELRENNQVQLKSLITEIASRKSLKGSVSQKIGDLYNLGMNTDLIETQGASPIEQELKSIALMKNKNELTGKMAELALSGNYTFFTVFGEADPQNSAMTIAWFYQSGLGIGDRDYYLEADMQNYRDEYVNLISKMFVLSGYNKIDNFSGKEVEMANSILELETNMAKVFIDKNELRDPDKTNNIRKIDEFQQIIPAIDIPQYIKSLGINDITSVNVATLSYFKGLNEILQNTDIRTIKAYLAWNVINAAAAYLSDDFVNADFAFYGKVLSGKEELKPRWKRVVETVDGALGEAVGQMYVEKYFPPESKQRMLDMVGNLQQALAERIKGNSWMTDDTKVEALKKLATFKVKIGYPDKWRDYSGLEISNDSYYANVVRARKFENSYQLAKIGKPVNKEEWLMTPQTVNAYYNPTTNEICFPAGILQPPFFDKNIDDAFNYGAIGVVIGHEMSHGFDDQGRKYDKDGNLNDWWNATDVEAFDNRKQVLVDWFNKIEVLNVNDQPIYANGEFTLGENIADNGGLNISYTALQKAKQEGKIESEMDGFTADQRFFIAYAQVWAGNIRDEEIIRRTKEDPHSLGKWRVNGTLPHISSFISAFKVKSGDKMYLSPEQRANIW